MRELRGAPVADAITAECKNDIEILVDKGIVPKLAVIRIGARGDDLAYERGIIRRFSSAGALVEIRELPDGATQEQLEHTVGLLNGDLGVHGILLLRPLPENLSETRIKELISPSKDVDCMSPVNLAALFEGKSGGYPPCTPQAVLDLLDFYGIGLTGKKVTVVGRSMVVGKPLALMLIARDATVTVCHTKTLDLAGECRDANIIVSCAGKAKMIGADAVRAGQVIVDVGVNMDGGFLCGDVDYGAVKDIVEAITPVPGGVGAVTTSVLLRNTVRSAMNAACG